MGAPGVHLRLGVCDRRFEVASGRPLPSTEAEVRQDLGYLLGGEPAVQERASEMEVLPRS